MYRTSLQCIAHHTPLPTLRLPSLATLCLSIDHNQVTDEQFAHRSNRFPRDPPATKEVLKCTYNNINTNNSGSEPNCLSSTWYRRILLLLVCMDLQCQVNRIAIYSTGSTWSKENETKVALAFIYHHVSFISKSIIRHLTPLPLSVLPVGLI